jgi:hypothetical protein
MHTLAQQDAPSFLERFYSFNDALLRRVEHSYSPSGHKQTTITISGRDQQSETGRSNVTLVIHDVSEIGFREGKDTRQVLSDGLTVAWFDERVWCDFSPYATEPESLDDFRRSDFYVVGKGLSWRTAPYGEDEHRAG